MIRIRRASFPNVQDVIGRIKRYPEHCNRTGRPFVWTAAAESIIAKIQRLGVVIGGTQQ